MTSASGESRDDRGQRGRKHGVYLSSGEGAWQSTDKPEAQREVTPETKRAHQPTTEPSQEAGGVASRPTRGDEANRKGQNATRNIAVEVHTTPPRAVCSTNAWPVSVSQDCRHRNESVDIVAQT